MSNPIPTEMIAVEISSPGGPEVLKPTRRALPRVAHGEVLVRVAAAGVNGPDIAQRKGGYPAPPGASDLPGLEVAGEVAAVGKSVERWKSGDRVCALANGGGYAQYVAVDARHCLPVPEGVRLEDAAGLPETYFTVWSNVFVGARLSAGETLLVHGGSGGIGTTAIQLGKAFGTTVIATDSPANRCQIASELGADIVVDYSTSDFVDVVRAAGGADVILDIVGGPYIERNVKAARHDGRIVQLAFALGSKVEFNFMPIMLKRLTYTGSTLRTRTDDYKARIATDLETKVWPLFAQRKLKPVTRTSLPLESAAQAHALMESATHVGKILLLPPV